MTLLFAVVFCVLPGCVLVFGTYERWQYLIDPTPTGDMITTQRFIRSVFGRKFLIWYTYVTGCLLILLGLIFLVLGGLRIVTESKAPSVIQGPVAPN